MELTCPNCGTITKLNQNDYPVRERIAPINMAFYHNGVRTEAYMVASNDMFFEITSGKYRGNLVHRWDIIK